MKYAFIFLFFSGYLSGYCQEFSHPSRTEAKDDAGQQGGKSGFFETTNPTNYPSGAAGWWHLLDVRHSNVGNNYAMQFAGSFFDQELFFRKTGNNGTAPWKKIMFYEPNGSFNIFLNEDAATRPYGIFLKTKDAAEGAGVEQTGIYLDFTHNYNYNQNLNGIYGEIRQNLGYNTKGVYMKAHTLHGTAVAIEGVGRHDDTNVPGTSIAIKVSIEAVSATNGTQGTTYAGYFSNEATAGTKNHGLYVNTNTNCAWGIYQSGNTKNYFSGNTLIGTTADHGYKLAVGGNMIAEQVKVKLQATGWPDYVFGPSYRLPSLQQTEAFIKANGHLPEIPSAKQVEKEGLDLGGNQALLLKKIEELTLHLIEINKKVEKLEIENKNLQYRLMK